MDNTNLEKNISPLKKALIAVEQMQQKIKQLESQKDEKIAVIGIGAKFPKANNADEFWNILLNGIDTVTEVPKDRWDIEDFYDQNKNIPGKIISRYGAFIDDFDRFDADFFGISPREATQMDPQQRILLEITWQALENANIIPDDIVDSKTGVFVGVSTNDYSLVQLERTFNDYKKLDAYNGSGNSRSIVANRLSYFYNFKGPSIALDTACSSSLVSVHFACQSLKNGESDLALAGGIGLILSPHASISFSNAQMLAPGGRCKTFDSGAEGYVRGEGAGIVVLKRFNDAIKDGDNILAVISGSAVNQDGKTNGLTAPNSLAQIDVINSAIENAKVSSSDIGFIETHGTGTILGDPIEIQALSEIMKNRESSQPCFLGAVKTNIGHLEAAAGIAGLIKTILILKNKIIPANLHFKKLNPYIKLNNSRFTIPTKAEKWISENRKRIAGVSSFGFGGTNAHIVLEEVDVNNIAAEKKLKKPQNLLCLSAENQNNLKKLTQEYLKFLENDISTNFNDICFTANNFRKHFNYRVAIFPEDNTQLNDLLKIYLNNEFDYRIIETKDYNISGQTLGMLFTGQGSQYHLMASELYHTFPDFRRIIDTCLNISDKITTKPLKEVIFNPNYDDTLIDETEFTQPILFILEYSLAKMWLDWGIKPSFLLGHSIGEYAAACIANVFSLEDGIKLTVLRGKLMQSLPKDGMMVSIFSNDRSVNEVIKLSQLDISIAANNGKNNTVISGNKIDVKKLLNVLDSKKIEYKILKVSHGFHSSLMDPILDEFEQIASSFTFQKPTIPIISNLDGNIIESIPDEKYWRKHLRNTVKFEEGIETLINNNCNILLEVGPNPVLTSMGKKITEDNSILWVNTLRRNTNDCQNIIQNLGLLYVNGINISWKNFYKDFSGNKVQLPSYQFSREKYYVEQENTLHQFFAQNKKNLKFVVLNDGKDKNKIKVVDENNFVLFERTNIEIEKVSSTEEYEKYKSKEVEVKKDSDTIKNNVDEIISDGLEFLPKEEKQKIIIEQLKNNLSKVLKLNPQMIKLDKSITLFGLDSIMSIELKNKIEQNYNITIPIVELVKGPTLLELSELIIKEFQNGEADLVKLESHKNITEYELSYGQNAMWFQHQMAPKSIFNPTYSVKVLNELDIEKFEKVISKIILRHSILRTNYKYNDSKPIQYITQNSNQFLNIINCSELDEETVYKKVISDAGVDFDIESGNIFKINIYLSHSYSIILISAHHIAVDFWSLATIVNEILLLYTKEVEFVLPEMQYSYIDFVIWQKKMLESAKGKKVLKYWKNKLDGEIPNLELPTKQWRKPIQTFDGNSISFLIPKDKSDSLKELAEQNNATLFMVMLSIFNVLLNKYTHQNDIIIGTPTSGRSLKEFDDIVGYFVNPLPIRTQFTNSIKFVEFLEILKQNVLEAIENQDYPFNLMVEKIQPQRDPSRTPIFQVMFVYQKAHILDNEGLSGFAVDAENMRLNIEGLEIENYKLEEKKSIFDMTLMIAETKLGISASLVYNTELFNESFIKRFANHFNKIIEQVLSNPKIKLTHVKLVDIKNEIFSDNESKEIVKSAKSDLLYVHKEFEKQVVNNPDKIAVQFKNESISYLELNIDSNRIAHFLLSKNLQPETRIGVFIERSFEMIKTILAIMKAGFVYVPIDTNYPNERINHIIQDANISLVISQEKHRKKINKGNLDLICIDLEEEAIAKYSNNNPETKLDKLNLAYSIYTSGSTGIPKGVLLTHQGLSNLVSNQTRIFEINFESKVIQLASLSFDASVSEIFTTLVKGATLLLVTNDVLLSGSALINELNEKKVSVATIPPSLLAVIPQNELFYLKTLISAGEACTKEIVNKWSDGRKFINAYGPTEVTVCATTYDIPRDIKDENIPIGNSIIGTKAHIFDENMNIVPVGVAGELHVSGIGLARGYNNLPALTAEKFIPNPYSKIPGERLYKTGDLVKLREDKNIEFLGRIDDQVKFRGFRIELSGIKTVLENYSKIKKVEIILTEINKEKKLIAYYVSENDEEITKNEIREYLIEHLPEYMIPTNFVKLETLPLTSNGKVNKKFLRNFKFEEIHSTYEKPESEYENEIIQIWKEILSLENIGRNDNFFDLGGHSLNVIQVQNKIKQKFDTDITIVDLFQFPTVKSFADFLQNGENKTNETKELVERTEMQKKLLLRRQAKLKNRGN